MPDILIVVVPIVVVYSTNYSQNQNIKTYKKDASQNFWRMEEWWRRKGKNWVGFSKNSKSQINKTYTPIPSSEAGSDVPPALWFCDLLRYTMPYPLYELSKCSLINDTWVGQCVSWNEQVGHVSASFFLRAARISGAASLMQTGKEDHLLAQAAHCQESEQMCSHLSLSPQSRLTAGWSYHLLISIREDISPLKVGNPTWPWKVKSAILDFCGRVILTLGLLWVILIFAFAP